MPESNTAWEYIFLIKLTKQLSTKYQDTDRQACSRYERTQSTKPKQKSKIKYILE